MFKRVLLALLFVAVAGSAYAGIAEPGPVPEPVSMWLLATGAAALGVRAYRKRRS